MPKPKQKNVSQTKKRAQTVEEESAKEDTASHPDTWELQVDVDMANLQIILQELRELA